MHNGYGRGNGNGNGKRWLLIGLLVLGGFWLVNDSYRNGFNDALVQSGQTGALRYYHGGPHFPWGLLIIAGIGYVAWRKGAFDRFGGPGGPFGGGYGGGERGVQRYDASHVSGTPGFGQGFGPAFRGPRAFFDEWHRQAHEAQAQAQRSTPAPPAGAPAPGNGTPPAGFAPAPPPPPPAPEYWAAMAGASPAPTPPPTMPQPQAQPQPPRGDGAQTPAGEAEPTLERW